MSGLNTWAGVVLTLASTAGLAQSEPVAKAKALVAQNKFAPALKLVEKATAEAGNDLETTLALLELSGVCNGALKKAAPAKAAFQKLLSLAPNFVLNRKGPAPVLKAFADAKATATPLTINPTAPDMSTGRISEIAVEVQTDPLKLAKTILFNYRADGGKWKVRGVPAALGRVAGKVDAARKVEWYAMVLGGNDAQLMRIRTVDSPITHTYTEPSPSTPPVVARAEPARTEPPPSDSPGSDAPRRPEPEPSLTPTDSGAAPIDVVDSGKGRAKWVAPTSVVLIAAGVAAGGVGTYFGFVSGGARRAFTDATNGTGSLVPLSIISRAQALELDSKARGNALIANSLWAAGGALLLTGAAVAIFGPDQAAAQ